MDSIDCSPGFQTEVIWQCSFLCLWHAYNGHLLSVNFKSCTSLVYMQSLIYMLSLVYMIAEVWWKGARQKRTQQSTHLLLTYYFCTRTIEPSPMPWVHHKNNRWFGKWCWLWEALLRNHEDPWRSDMFLHGSNAQWVAYERLLVPAHGPYTVQGIIEVGALYLCLKWNRRIKLLNKRVKRFWPPSLIFIGKEMNVCACVQ